MDFKSRRESIEMTQETLAKRMGVKRSTVAMWETGKSLPRADKLMELAKLFSCTVDELLAGAGQAS